MSRALAPITQKDRPSRSAVSWIARRACADAGSIGVRKVSKGLLIEHTGSLDRAGIADGDEVAIGQDRMDQVRFVREAFEGRSPWLAQQLDLTLRVPPQPVLRNEFP